MATEMERDEMRAAIGRLLKTEQGRHALDAAMAFMEMTQTLTLDEQADVIGLFTIFHLYPKTALGAFSKAIATERLDTPRLPLA